MKTRHDRRSGRNPWLGIPAADYLGHMESPDVDQLSILAGILRGSLERLRPESLLVLGCSLRRRHAVEAKQGKALLAIELCRGIRATRSGRAT